MMIHKFLHLNQSVETAKRRLAHIARFFPEVSAARATLDAATEDLQWRMRTPFGLTQPLQLTPCPMGIEGKYLFQQNDLHLKVIGYVQFHTARHNLTELEIAVYYEVKGFALRWLDQIFNIGEFFANRQLSRLREHLSHSTGATPFEPVEVVTLQHAM